MSSAADDAWAVERHTVSGGPIAARRGVPVVQFARAHHGLQLLEIEINRLGTLARADLRWPQRPVRIAQLQAAAPMASIPSAGRRDRAAIKGQYRMIDLSTEYSLALRNILAARRERKVSDTALRSSRAVRRWRAYRRGRQADERPCVSRPRTARLAGASAPHPQIVRASNPVRFRVLASNSTPTRWIGSPRALYLAA